MFLTTGLLIVTAISAVAMFVNDRFDLGGYLEDEQQDVSIAQSSHAETERELVGAGLNSH